MCSSYPGTGKTRVDSIQVSWQKWSNPEINQGKNYWKSFKWHYCFVENWEFSIYVLNWLVNSKNLLNWSVQSKPMYSYEGLLLAASLLRAENWPMFFWATESPIYQFQTVLRNREGWKTFLWDGLSFKEEGLEVASGYYFRLGLVAGNLRRG